MTEKCRGCGEPLPVVEDDPYNELKHENNCLASKLGVCVEALECLLPGLTLDLRYADDDDDKAAMRSRIRTVTDALTTVKP